MPKDSSRIEILTGDITTLTVGVIVNAANASLLGGGGVDGAIHRAAGSRLLEHNQAMGGCPTGQARLTPAFDLERQGIKHIIHAVGPVWDSASAREEAPIGTRTEDQLLACCYDAAMALADSVGAVSIAFPAISTGVYGFPKARAAHIALRRIGAWLADREHPRKAVICCFSESDANIYRNLPHPP